VLGLDQLIFAGAKAEAPQLQLAEELIDILVRSRKMAREQKQFALADFIRDELAKLGIRLQDLPSGTIWLKD
jgi:cysteinyl-tRNA synthetase